MYMYVCIYIYIYIYIPFAGLDLHPPRLLRGEAARRW